MALRFQRWARGIMMLQHQRARVNDGRWAARHGVSRLTMRYTDVGLDDQGRVGAAILPPRNRPQCLAWSNVDESFFTGHTLCEPALILAASGHTNRRS